MPTESFASIDGLFQVIDMAMNERRFDVLFRIGGTPHEKG
jgi:hypothetical protein